MGFRLARTYVLEFEGDMQGAIVKIKGTSAAVARKLRQMDGDSGAEEYAALLSQHIVSWNFEDENGETSSHHTADAILNTLEEVELAAIVREWFRAAAGVTAPLDVRSTNIGRSLEGEIPMESVPLPN